MPSTTALVHQANSTKETLLGSDITVSQLLQSKNMPIYIAHKGGISSTYHGNTLEALQESLEHPVKSIELDIRLSRDHVPFLYHEETLEESTNGSGKPEKHTWSQLKRLTYNTPHREHIPSLEEVFQLIGNRKIYFLDIKTSHIQNCSFAKSLEKLIHKYHLQDHIVVESFNPLFLMLMKLRSNNIYLMYSFLVNSTAIGEELQSQFDMTPWILKQPFIQKQICRILKPDFIGPRWNTNLERLATLAKKNPPVICWTVDDPQIAKQLLSLGVSGIQTNETKLLYVDQNVRSS